MQIQTTHANENIKFSVPRTILPRGSRNYCLFNNNYTEFIASTKEASIPYIKENLKYAPDEKELLEILCITDKMLDKKTKNMEQLYPYLAKYNNTSSPNIQAYLAGIYRKMQIPDAFGPLVSMLVKNISMSNTNQISNFDPNEEIGGAILSYIENYSNKRSCNCKLDTMA